MTGSSVKLPHSCRRKQAGVLGAPWKQVTLDTRMWLSPNMAPTVLSLAKAHSAIHLILPPAQRNGHCYYHAHFADEERKARSTYVFAKAQAVNGQHSLDLNHSSKGNPCLPRLPGREEIRKLHVLSKQDQRNQLPVWTSPWWDSHFESGQLEGRAHTQSYPHNWAASEE